MIMAFENLFCKIYKFKSQFWNWDKHNTPNLQPLQDMKCEIGVQ